MLSVAVYRQHVVVMTRDRIAQRGLYGAPVSQVAQVAGRDDSHLPQGLGRFVAGTVVDDQEVQFREALAKSCDQRLETGGLVVGGNGQQAAPRGGVHGSWIRETAAATSRASSP